MRKKILKVTRPLFAWALMIMMTAALIAALFYVAAFFTGPEIAGKIHHLFYNVILHYMYVAGIAVAFLGVFNMYLAGEKMYVFEVGAKKNGGETAGSAK